MTKTPTPFHVLLYEGRGAIPLSPDARLQVFAALLDKGYAVTRVTESRKHEEGVAPHESPADRLLVLGDFGGDAPELSDAENRTDIATRDIHGLNGESVLGLVEHFREGIGAEMNQPGQWKPWFPVIDYDRCTNCMQCLSFCLFDVYGVDDDQQIQVQNNDNCKTNCPACSRVCPEVAIMFPKYASGPINGEVVNSSDVEREKMKVDISSLLGGDIYSTLRDRSTAAKSRFSAERSADKALNERKKCLVKMQGQGLIPPEVLAELDLASLPSPDEIKRRAEDVAAKARAYEAEKNGD